MGFLPSVLYPCSNAHNSGLEFNFSKIQKPSLISLVCTSPRHKIQDNCSLRIQAMVGFLERGFLIHPCSNAHNSGQEWSFLKI